MIGTVACTLGSAHHTLGMPAQPQQSASSDAARTSLQRHILDSFRIIR